MILFGKFCVCRLQGRPITKHDLQMTEKNIMAKLSELGGLLAPIAEGLQAAVDAVSSVGPQLEKAKVEIIAAMGGEAEIPAEALAKLQLMSDLANSLKTAGEGLKQTAQALDDLNPG